MLNFIFTLESLALSLGCNRSQLLIGVKQSSQGLDDPAKIGLLWTTEWLLTLRKLEEIREFFNDVINNEMLIKSFPEYLNGFILSLTFAPRISKFVVELLSKLFATVPDKILLPWLPGLILKLRPHAQILQALIKEASNNFPKNLSGFNHWVPAWSKPQLEIKEQVNRVEAAPTLSENELKIREFLFNYPATTNALAKLLGIENLTWQENLETHQAHQESLSETELKTQELIKNYPATLNYFAGLLNSSFSHAN